MGVLIDDKGFQDGGRHFVIVEGSQIQRLFEANGLVWEDTVSLIVNLQDEGWEGKTTDVCVSDEGTSLSLLEGLNGKERRV